MQGRFVVAVVCIVGIQVVTAEPTARTYCFAAMESNFNNALIDSLAKYFDVVITHDDQRIYNPRFRDSTKVAWRRDEPPWVLLYKDAMTLIGPRANPNPPPDTIPADSTRGGGDTPGGFWYYDSIFFGYGAYNQDTFFMMKSDSTPPSIVDEYDRVHAGSPPSWEWRWAMDYGEADWQSFYGCSTKVQCMRNYITLEYDNTYFDGIFIDNLLQWVNHLGYNMYPIQYWKSDSAKPDHNKFRNAVHTFAQTASAEYHNSSTPPGHGKQILGIANLNNTYRTPGYDSIWRMNVNVLDGGMEESFVTMGCSSADWHKFLHEISIAESLGKTCLMCHKVDSFDWTGHMPFDYTEFDSTDLMYGFTSYLMAFDSLACFYFTPKDSHHYSFVCRVPIVDVNIGKPMAKYLLTDDNLGYRYYEEAVVFCNSTENSLTAGFSGDTLYELGPLCDIRDTLNGQFYLGHHRGVIGLYAPNYFHGSGFEPDDRLCWEHYCLGAQGITNYDAKRVSGVPPNGVTPHSGDWMYKVYGQDESIDTSFVRFKVFPYDVLIEDPTYLSFWIYIEDAPGDSAPIGLDCLLKSGKQLSEWTKYGTILDQYGREINPAGRRVPKDAWYQYVFTFNPAVNETLDHIEVVYFDESSGTGEFCAYIDDIEILDSFPITDCWHCEKFPTSPTNGDPNFYMNFVAQDDSVKLIINPQGNGGEGPHWVEPTPGLRNDITDIPIDSTTTVIWSQYDRAHSLILGLLIRNSQGQKQWLSYAKNASNHWGDDGWVNMGDTATHYLMWEGFFRNVRDDYLAEYSTGAEPESITELRLQHFARSEWVGDSGGTIGYLAIAPFTQEFAINQNQTYTNLPYVALRTKANSLIDVDSMQIWQNYVPQQETLRYSTGWLPYDTAYCWYLRQGEGDNKIFIQYKFDGYCESPVYSDTIIFDETSPAGAFVINNNSPFANEPSVVLYNSMNDALSSVALMRYGNMYLKDLVVNSAFDSSGNWEYDEAAYHDSLTLFEIPVTTGGSYFYQSILPESLAAFDDDTLLLWIDVVSDGFSGNVRVEFQYIIGDPDSVDLLGEFSCGASIPITGGTNAHVSHYNLCSLFVYNEPVANWSEARVGVFVRPSAQNKGRLFIDNLRLDVVSPHDDYTLFENFDTTTIWTLTPGNGVKKVYGQFADGSGNETGVLWDSIIVDTTKPIAIITSPPEDRVLNGSVGITGYAFDCADPVQHFKKYGLYYNPIPYEEEQWFGIHPDSVFYNPIDSNSPTEDLAKWDTRQVTEEHGDGWCILKLVVSDSAGNNQIDTVLVYIDNERSADGEIAGFANDVYGLAVGEEIFVGELGTGKIYRYDGMHQLLDTFTLADSLGIGLPLAMALDSSGKLWVANIISQYVNRFTPQGNLLLQFGGDFSLPSGIALDETGNEWVSDRLHHKIKRFDSQGNLLLQFGVRGNAPGEINRPIGVASHGGKIHVADSRNTRISVFDTLGTFIRIIGDSAGIGMPFGIVVDSTGCVFVSDALNSQVIEFGPSGNRLFGIDSILDSPTGLALSPDQKTLYVSDTRNRRVLAFAVREEPPLSGGGPQAMGEVDLENLAFDVSPSPFSGRLAIKLQGVAGSRMTLKIYDVAGRLIKTFFDNDLMECNQHILWDGRDNLHRKCAVGVYFLRLEIGKHRETRKTILVK